MHLHPYPNKLCLACGLKHGFRSADAKVEWEENGTCEVCEETNANVTSPASFGHLRGAWGYKEKNTKEVTTLPTKVEVVSKRAEPPPVEEKPRQYRELG